MNEPEWFAIWTRAHHERIVRDQLDGMGIEVFLPTINRKSRRKDREQRVEWPLFPGYCFARFPLAERLPILKCKGIVCLVGAGNKPEAVPTRDIESVRRLIESALAFDAVPVIKEGMLVEVKTGPLRGVVGRMVRQGAHARLVLSVDLISRALSVEVAMTDVVPC